MPYTTQDVLVARYGESMLISLTDRASMPTGAIDSSIVDQALADTDAMIDGYLAVRYALPLASTPALIANLAATIAIWKLHIFQPDPKIAADYASAVNQLAAIAAGNLRIPVDGIAPTGTGGSGARVTDRARPLTADNLKGFI